MKNNLKKIITKSPQASKKIAFNLASDILRQKERKQALILALSGELGSGKTTFLQGFALGLGIKEKVNSPTFVILKKFKVFSLSFKFFYHLDCYRIKSAKEMQALGFKEIIKDPANIVAIEWPENIKTAIPKTAIKIHFTHQAPTHRQIIIN